MDNFDLYNVVNNINNVTDCILFLIGVGAGIFAILRKNRLGGILTAVGFALLGFNLVQNVVFYVVLIPRMSQGGSDIAGYMSASTCFGGALYALGLLALIAGFIVMAVRKPGPAVPEAEPPLPPA